MRVIFEILLLLMFTSIIYGQDPYELCNSKIDAIFTTLNGDTYVFKGDKFWRLTSEGIAPGYPRLIATHWGGQLPNNIDAAFTWRYKDGLEDTFIFKEDLYWQYKNSTTPFVFNSEEVQQGKEEKKRYNNTISDGFPGVPNSISSAFFLGGKTYFTKGDDLWIYEYMEDTDTDRVSKKSLSKSWQGFPDNIPNIEATIRSTYSQFYLFKNGEYFLMENTGNDEFRVVEASPSFPRNAGEWWFGCDPGLSSTPLSAALTLVAPVVAGLPDDDEEDDFDCPKDGLFPDPNSDCRAFFKCQGVQSWRFNCSPTLKFDATDVVCKYEGDVDDNCNVNK